MTDLAQCFVISKLWLVLRSNRYSALTTRCYAPAHFALYTNMCIMNNMNTQKIQKEATDLVKYVKRTKETTVIAGGIIAIAVATGFIMGTFTKRGEKEKK